jgi:hypothetical protein
MRHEAIKATHTDLFGTFFRMIEQQQAKRPILPREFQKRDEPDDYAGSPGDRAAGDADCRHQLMNEEGGR